MHLKSAVPKALNEAGAVQASKALDEGAGY